MRRPAVAVVVGLEDLEQPPHLRQAGAAGRLDLAERLGGRRRVRFTDGSRRTRLHDHHAHVVRDDVVQLACDGRTLGGDGLARRELPVAHDPPAAVERHPAEQHRDAEREDEVGQDLDPVQAAVPPLADADRDRGETDTGSRTRTSRARSQYAAAE